MRILREGKDIEYKGICERCGTEFAYLLKETYKGSPGYLCVRCPVCEDEIEATFKELSDIEKKTRDVLKSWYS